MTKPYVDLAVVIPLVEEFTTFNEIFRLSIEETDGFFRLLGKTCEDQITVLAAPQETMGRTAASATARHIFQHYDVGVIVCLGIAGGLSKDAKIGDVCCTGTILDILDNNKIVDASGGYKMEFDPDYYNSPTPLVTALNYVRISPGFRPIYKAWQDSSLYEAIDLLPTPYPGADGIVENISEPEFHTGDIVCGPVMKSALFKSDLTGLGRKLLAIETEAGGVFYEADRAGIPAWCVRGISDYGDANKNAFEKATGGNARKVAARNATTFLQLQLQNPLFREMLAAKQRASSGLSTTVSGSGAVSSLASAIVNSNELIDLNLRELCPAFKYKPKGYRLPIPRVQLRDAAIPEKVDENFPVDIQEALRERQSILISVPRSYADNSLPWVIASDLLRAEQTNVQHIPVVIDGNKFGPPKNGFRNQLSEELRAVVDQEGVSFIFILYDFSVASTSKANFLVEELAAYNDSKLVVLSQGQSNIAAEHALSARLAASEYTLCSVSFKEMASFLEKNFEMSGAEAEVAAFKLSETFRRFDLSASPTYFAGITRETLVALIEANRRSELIQLAVDGVLSFVVADDKASVVLSRTTRARFLRSLVFEIKVNGCKFDRAALVTYTEKFASRFDFDIEPVGFIAGFVSNGILYFPDGFVSITLPYIESYLLAVELVGKPEIAGEYYKSSRSDFDFVSFDIYSELSPAITLAEGVCQDLSAVVQELRAGQDGDHILLTNEIKPVLLASSARLRAVEREIKKALADVSNNISNSAEKGRMMDLRDRAQARANKAAEDMGEGEGQGQDYTASKLDEAFRLWSISVVLIGSGAEHLEASLKRKLAATVVEAAAVLIDLWSRAFMKIDFMAFKAEILSNSNIEHLYSEDNRGDDAEIRSFLEKMVDFFEYTIMSYPLRRMLDHLCNVSRQKVLAASLEKIEVHGKIEQVISGVWLADIDSDAASKKLLPAIRALPPARFLRLTLASHFLARVYWSHWKPEARLSLLGAATESLSPLMLELDKGQIRRQIARENNRKRSKNT